MKKKVAIIGSGDLGQLIAHYLQQNEAWQVIGFYDDFQPIGQIIQDLPVLGKIADIFPHYKVNHFQGLMMGIGYKHFQVRKELYEKFSSQILFPNFIHPQSYVDERCQLDQGIIILPNCTLDKQVKIEANVFMNIACAIAHDSQIGAHSFLAPSVNIAGHVKIGQACFLGIGTNIIEQISITNEVQSGAGSTIIQNIHQKGVYVGTPARKIR